MTDEERMLKFEEMKQKTIARLLGDSKCNVPNTRKTITSIDIKQYQEQRKQKEIANNITVLCKDFFNSQRNQRDNGGYIIRQIKDIPSEIPPPIK